MKDVITDCLIVRYTFDRVISDKDSLIIGKNFYKYLGKSDPVAGLTFEQSKTGQCLMRGCFRRTKILLTAKTLQVFPVCKANLLKYLEALHFPNLTAFPAWL